MPENSDNLQMRRVTAKFVPHLMMAVQKDDRVSICTASVSEPKMIELHVLDNHL